MNEKSVRITDPGKSPTPAQIKKWLGEEAYRYWIRMNEEPRSPESLRDEVSYRKELLFPYSLANPAAELRGMRSLSDSMDRSELSKCFYSRLDIRREETWIE